MARSTAHPGTTRATARTSPVTVPVSGTALLLIDVINDLAFDGSEALVAQAEAEGRRRGVGTAQIPLERPYSDHEAPMMSRGGGAHVSVELEAKAVRQWEAIEERRRALVTRTFSATDPRAE